MNDARAHAKINLGLVVGPTRADGRHEVVTLLQRVDLFDTVSLDRVTEPDVTVEGFDDTIVTHALAAFSAATDGLGWHVRIAKRIPVASGLGGGSSDAAAALRLANEIAPEPLPARDVQAIAADVGSDVPFFLREGAQLATGDGSELEPVSLPLDYWVVLALPVGVSKESTAAVYARFDERRGEGGFADRRAAFLSALERIERAEDLALLPGNDLASSPLVAELVRLGAFRADVSGAGPAVYGLFESRERADGAAGTIAAAAETWVLRPVAA